MTKFLFSVLAGGIFLATSPLCQAQTIGSVFASETIDIGVLVSDVEKSAKFYTEAIGFKEVPGFTVPADWTKDVGLTDGQDLKIRVFVLGEGKTATKLKLMQVGDSKTVRKNDTKFISSEYGFRYLTLVVTDMTAALERVKKAGFTPATKNGMIGLPEGFPKDIYLTLLRDPDGNMIELVGPKAAR